MNDSDTSMMYMYAFDTVYLLYACNVYYDNIIYYIYLIVLLSIST